MRYEIHKYKDHTEIHIPAYRDALKQKLLIFWILLWSICGLIIFIQIFFPYTREQKLFFVLFLSFWAYYEWKTLSAYQWRKKGKEKIIITPHVLRYTRSVGRQEQYEDFPLSRIQNLRIIDTEVSPLLRQMSNSYWSVSGETIAFDYAGKTYGLGLELHDKEKKELLDLLKNIIHSFQHATTDR